MLTKAFRLFVSSTFADLAQEREVLQSKVFPALDAYCAAKGYQFHAIDLRWGVNEEAQLDQRTTEICLGEVAAAKRYPSPNFLIMVGDRYGWVPLPFAIPQDEFEAATAWLAERGRAGDAGDLRKVYRLDENYLVPPGLAAAAGSSELIGAYTLRSREDEIREFAPPKAWQELEDRLRGALQEAADHLLQEGRIRESTCAKYFLSLTEQEIIRGLPGYNTGAQNGAQVATVQPDNDRPQAIAWIREPAAPSLLRRVLRVAPHPPTKATAAVVRLKARIRQALPTDCVLSGRLEDFAARIETRLRAAIDSHIARFEAEERSELVQERAQHEDFAAERRRIFVGRDSNRAAIERYLAGDSPHPLVLFGPSGLGKSALVARTVADAEERDRGVPAVCRFVGASAASADVRSLLVSIVEDLAARGIVVKPEHWEDDLFKFDEQIRTLFTSIDKPAVVFIDALDQLRNPRLAWLPDKLPPGFKIVVSVLNDSAYDEDSGVYRALRQRLPAEAFLEIEPLTQPQGRDILLALEASAQMRLRPAQRDYVLSRFESAGASPLYLSVAFEIARAWRSWDEPGKGRCVLVGDTATVIGQHIDELTSVHHHEPRLVASTLGYLAAAKDGLSAKEMTEVLSGDAGVMQPISRAAGKHGVQIPSVERHGRQEPKLPDSVWVRLNRQLAPLLVEKRVDEQPLLNFFHRQLADMARERHYARTKSALHGALADYFDAGAGTAAKDAVPSGRRTYARRSLSELPYQLFHAGRRARLDEILMAPDWMQQKLLAYDDPRPLINDYQYARTKAQKHTGRALELAAGIIARDERQLVPQLLGRLMGSSDPVVLKLLEDARNLIKAPTLLTWRPSLTPPGAETARLDGHFNALAALSGNLLATASNGNGIQLWRPRHTAELRRVALESEVRAMCPLRGTYLACAYPSGSIAQSISVIDTASGTETVRLQSTSAVHALCGWSNGRLVSAHDDGSILVWWDHKTEPDLKLRVGNKRIVSIQSVGDESLIAASSDGTITLVRISSPAEFTDIGIHRGLEGIAIPASDILASFGYNETKVQLWDINRRVPTYQFENTAPVSSLATLADGRLGVGLSDGKIRILRLPDRQIEHSLSGHTADVVALTDLGDNVIASCSKDGTARIWDLDEEVKQF